MLKKIILALLFNILFANFVIANKELPVFSGIGGNFHALDMYGKSMQLNDYKGKVVVLSFGYTNCPDICPFTLGYLNDLYQKLPKYAQENIQIMFLTIDPKYDTPQHLKDFISYFNKDFIGITGQTKKQTDYIANLFKIKYKKIGENLPVEDIRIVVKKQNSKSEDDKISLFDHSVTIYLIDTEGEVRNISYTGTPKAEFINNILALMPTIKVEDFRIRNSAKNARFAAAYGKITNLSNQQDVLLSVSSSIAKRTEFHQTKIVEGFAKMLHRSNQVFQPRQTLTLKPMSYHIMFIGLKKPISSLDSVDITLHFKHAGEVPIKINLKN